MHIQLLQGVYNKSGSLEIITKMIHIIIKYHEQKINTANSEAEIKSYETKITRLQKELFNFQKGIDENNEQLKLDVTIKVLN